MSTHNTREGIEEVVAEFDSKFYYDHEERGLTYLRNDVVGWLRTTIHQELQKAREESGKRNAVVKEYKDEGVMFVLKVEDGKTYEASMPIPKWAEVGKLTLRDQSELDQPLPVNK